ncbi:hypothetical protein [Streptomyces sp. 6N223]|uniref:hypothetical protein n=1 Tax=Streptomyces sp. 6N223 TaxID=3457412 RepID=UPI003FCFAA0C
MRGHGLARAGALALTVTLAAGASTACDVQRAVDCAVLALEVSNAGDRVAEAVATSVIEDDADAFRELAEDIEELQDRVQDTDVREAAESVGEAAENIEQAVERGETPDLSPLVDATSELTGVCTPSDGDNS